MQVSWARAGVLKANCIRYTESFKNSPSTPKWRRISAAAIGSKCKIPVKDHYDLNQNSFIPGKTYIPATTKTLDQEDLVHLVDACLDLWLTSGRFSKEFELMLASFIGCKVPGLLVNSGSSANLVSVTALGSSLLSSAGMRPLRKGDEVLTVAAGFPTTVSPIVQNGLVPVFVDIDLETLNVCFEKLLAAVSKQTRAVVLAHTLGNPFAVERISNWCRQEGFYLIEDCCDALGSKVYVDGRPRYVGSFGEFSTYSFYPAHHITTGEGGAVLAANPLLRKIAQSIRDWGRDCWCDTGKDNTCGKRFNWKLGDLPEGYDHKYVYSHLGYNLKMTDIQAALGKNQLKKLSSFIQIRRENWQILHNGIAASPLLREYLVPVQACPESEPNWFGFAVRCSPGVDRRKLMIFLEEHKIGTRLVFGGNFTKQPAYQGVNYQIRGDLKNTDEIMERSFWFAVHQGLTVRHLEYILDQLEAGIRGQV